MAVSPHTRVLQTKVRYRKKRKTMVFPPVCHTAVKLYHGDRQDETGIFPHSVGYFPTKKPETIDLETVVSVLEENDDDDDDNEIIDELLDEELDLEFELGVD